MKKYGLWHKTRKCMLGFHTSSNGDGEFCDTVSYELETYSNNIWLVEKKSEAEYAKNNSTSWYNASYETPINPFDGKDLEVKEITLTWK